VKVAVGAWDCEIDEWQQVFVLLTGMFGMEKWYSKFSMQLSILRCF